MKMAKRGCEERSGEKDETEMEELTTKLDNLHLSELAADHQEGPNAKKPPSWTNQAILPEIQKHLIELESSLTNFARSIL